MNPGLLLPSDSEATDTLMNVSRIRPCGNPFRPQPQFPRTGARDVLCQTVLGSS